MKMNINFSQKLYDLNRKVIQDVKVVQEPDGEGGTRQRQESKEMILRSVVSVVLQATMPGDDKLGADKRIELFNLLMKVNGEPVVEMSVEEIVLIKARVASAGFNNLIVGQTLVLLEGNPNPLTPLKKEEDSGRGMMEEPVAPPVEEISETDVSDG